MNKSERAKVYLDYLTEEGFRPSLDSTGDVQFKAEGDLYHILIDEKHEDYFSLMRFLGMVKNEEQERALDAANFVGLGVQVAKVGVYPPDEDNGKGCLIGVAVEMFISHPDDFRNVFSRSLGALKLAAETFSQKFWEKVPAEVQRVA